MRELAPTVWPSELRVGFCWLRPEQSKSDCKMKEGNPFGPFWNELNVDFADTVGYHLNYDEDSIDQWKQTFPSDRYPVIAFRGAPASFPMDAKHRYLQKYMNWSDVIIDEVRHHQRDLFNNQSYIGEKEKKSRNSCQILLLS